ncbi:MAG TPA: M48 family metallopeptidase [Planctomycetaceae bacterium]|nr:M48 family metallopeptidase [Planctomycetaceae bacterium]
MSRFDLATRDDLLYGYWLRPLVSTDDAAAWKWPKEFVDQAGKWAAAYVDGRKILEAALDGCPIDGQQALAPLDQVVSDCAKVLSVPKPRVIVRNDPYPRAYLVAVGDQPHLVLTSSLLELFEPAPDQLRFVIGRELGRIKCDHLRLRQVSFGLMVLLQQIDEPLLPASAGDLLMTYSVGRWLTWSREGEISADRAGLVCCGSPDVAYEALATLLNGIKADSAWRDPRHPKFDADRIIQEFQAWEKQTVVAVVRYVRQQSLSAPFVVERLAALKQYVASGQYQALLDRPATANVEVVTMLEGLDLIGLAPAGSGVSAYVKCFVGDRLMFTTPTAPYGAAAYFKDFRTSLTGTVGEPLFFEVWSDGVAYDQLLGGFVIYPSRPEAAAEGQPQSVRQRLTARILWDWKDRATRQQPGIVHASVRLIPVP